MHFLDLFVCDDKVVSWSSELTFGAGKHEGPFSSPAFGISFPTTGSVIFFVGDTFVA